MKFTAEKDILLKEIAIAQEIIANKTSFTILANVLLIAQNESLTIKATDSKVTFETTIPVEVKTEGSATVFCDKFISIISSLPKGDIEITQKGNEILISSISKKAQFHLKTISATDYPAFTVPQTENSFTIATADLKEMIHQTIFSVSYDETRHFMNGIFFKREPDALLCVATDGRRLALVKKENLVSDFDPVIVPTKILNILHKRMSSEGLVSINIQEKHIYFSFNAYKFSSVLIDGNFPDYSRVIPKEQAHSFEIEKNDFLEGLKRVSLLVEQRTRRIILKVLPGKLIVLAKESEIGNAEEEIPCQYNDIEMSFAVNYTYFEEPLKALNTNRVIVEFTEPLKALTIKPIDSSDVFYIVMPMQAE